MKIIITEQQNEKLNLKIRLVVEKLGVYLAANMFGEEIIRQAYNDNPISFLEQFDNLRPIDMGEEIYYVDKNNDPIFFYYKEHQELKNGFYHISYNKIWVFFEGIMGYDDTEIQEIMKEWLATTYNLKELEPIEGDDIDFAEIEDNL